ncbi:MAG: MerR family transcriptional regulator [Alphaproteobacteria bacterium]|nr:MerR family transcriptional regulator [Alphaproteobacteria bacterium]
MKQATLPFLRNLTEDVSSDGMRGPKKNDSNNIVEAVCDITEAKVFDKQVDSTLIDSTKDKQFSDAIEEDYISDGKVLSKKSENAYHTIGETSDLLGVPTHVLRFWEEKFSILNPVKRNGGRRYYRPLDLKRLKQIKDLLYTQGYTIKGVQQLFKSKKTDIPPVERKDLPEPASNATLKEELNKMLNEVITLRQFLKN